MYEVYSKIFQLKLFKIGYNKNYEIIKSDFDKFFKLKPKILFLPNPNQPIENTLNLKDIEKIALKCKRKKCFLVVDEAYHHFGSKSAVPLIKKFKNIIVLKTFSKAFGVPSIRTGFTVSDKKNMDILSKARIAHELSSVSYCSRRVSFKKLRNCKKKCKKNSDIKGSLKKELKKIGLETRSQFGNYILIKFQNSIEAKKVVKFLKKIIYMLKALTSNLGRILLT